MTHVPHVLLVANFRVPPCSEWATNQHRDSIASHVGHSDMLAYFAVAENNATGRVRYQLLEVKQSFASLRPTEIENQLLRCTYCTYKYSPSGGVESTPSPTNAFPTSLLETFPTGDKLEWSPAGEELESLPPTSRGPFLRELFPNRWVIHDAKTEGVSQLAGCEKQELVACGVDGALRLGTPVCW